jgi:hypothetical protein
VHEGHVSGNRTVYRTETLHAWRDALLMTACLVVGLAIDVCVDLPGQLVLSGAVWGVLLYALPRPGSVERQAVFACLAIATAGELFLSLVWGLYTYRLENVPLFVPPGHAMLLLVGMRIAQTLSARSANAILAAAAAYAFAAAAIGLDTFAPLLVAALGIVSFIMPAHRPLYASTFVLALALELYGTWLGNWVWSHEVPVIGLVTTNPPGIASAFYAVLDALVACTAVVIAHRAKAAQARPASVTPATVNAR